MQRTGHIGISNTLNINDDFPRPTCVDSWQVRAQNRMPSTAINTPSTVRAAEYFLEHFHFEML